MTRVGPLEFVPDVGYVEQRPDQSWRVKFDEDVARDREAAHAIVARRDAQLRREARWAKRAKGRRP